MITHFLNSQYLLHCGGIHLSDSAIQLLAVGLAAACVGVISFVFLSHQNQSGSSGN